MNIKKNSGEILIADDNLDNLKLMTMILNDAGYKVRPATDGQQAISSIDVIRPDLILLDIMMPDMSGFEVCKRLKMRNDTQDIPIIFISAMDDVASKVKGFECGGVDFIGKPVQVEEVLVRVNNHMRLHHMNTELAELVEKKTADLTQTNNDLIHSQERLKQQTQIMRQILFQTIDVVAATIEKRDPYTAGHQRRVTELSLRIAKELSLDQNVIDGLRLGASIHDVGKIYIPAEILARPGQLIKPEFDIIKTHPEVGFSIMKDVNFPWPVAQMIYQHHERIDGSGYPQGLKEDEILLEAKIIAVADVVEAIISHRPYRKGLGKDVALAEIKTWIGKKYDQEVSDACLHLFNDDLFNFND